MRAVIAGSVAFVTEGIKQVMCFLALRVERLAGFGISLNSRTNFGRIASV